jgi:hypothetical protein
VRALSGLATNNFGVEGRRSAVCKDFLFNGHPAARSVDLYRCHISIFIAWPSRRIDKVTTEIKTTYISANFRTSSDELSDLDA